MFSIKESLKYGWEKFKTNKSVWAATLAMMVLYILSSPSGSNYGGMHGYHGPSFGIITIIAFIALLVARVGYTKLFLQIADGESFDWPKALETVFNTHKVFWKYFWTSILFGIAIGIGIVLLIIPGLIILTMYAFSTFIVVDHSLGPIAAMKESALITKGSRMKILGFLIVIGVLNILGAIALGIGLFITIPVSLFAMIDVYRKLKANKESIVIK